MFLPEDLSRLVCKICIFCIYTDCKNPLHHSIKVLEIKYLLRKYPQNKQPYVFMICWGKTTQPFLLRLEEDVQVQYFQKYFPLFSAPLLMSK